MKQKEFTVMVILRLNIDLAVKADSLEDALEKAKNLAVEDVVDLNSIETVTDWDLEIDGVFKI